MAFDDELGRIFGFTTQDLEVNQRREVSPAQRRSVRWFGIDFLVRATLLRLPLGLALLVATWFIATAPGLDRHDAFFLGLGGFFGVAGLVLTLDWVRCIVKYVGSASGVKIAEGPLQKMSAVERAVTELLTSGNARADVGIGPQPWRWVEIDGKRHWLVQGDFDALSEQDLLRVYYVDDPLSEVSKFLSVERVS
ncbi:MAG: hypothetical protein JWM80_2126 [Cyanobacteria bacterium RYN_339]|nr:hypothetical protein [Cyanobacteria bacterium RYN_339]